MSGEDDIVVVDNGSGTLKAGFAGNDEPNVVFPSLVGRPRSQVMFPAAEQMETYVGDKAQEMRQFLSLDYPIERGIVTDWDNMEALWEYMYSGLKVPSEERPVLISESVRNPRHNKELMAQVMFEKFGVPKFYVSIATVLSVYANGRCSSIAIECGDGTVQTTPIYEGRTMQPAITRMDIGGRDLTEYLTKLLRRRGYSFSTLAEMDIVRDMKEQMCYVAPNFENEMSKEASVVEENYTLPDGQVITLGDERFRCPEMMFEPSLSGEKFPALHNFIHSALMNCDIDTRRDLCANIMVTGGNSLFPGLKERLIQEITPLFPATMGVRVLTPPERRFSVWIGGSVLGSLLTFQEMLVSKLTYEEHGPTIVHRRCF